MREKNKTSSASSSADTLHITKALHHKRLFTKELRMMLYGFGDVENPRADTVDLVEDLTQRYLAELLRKAQRFSASGRGGKVKTEDILYQLRGDQKKFARVEELLFMNEELKRARKAFEVEDIEEPRV